MTDVITVKEAFNAAIEALELSRGDTEKLHAIYDETIRLLARLHEPELVAELEKIVDRTSFWYS